uniref:Gypsy retrotransposon integrase-like protein 1 n=1 Tax=Oryzias latipes TaxID=8090 RepID=A0A3P9HPM2_ORYLA
HGAPQSIGWNNIQEHVCRIWTGNPKVKIGNTSEGAGNERAKNLWDFQIQTDRMVMANQPDIVAVDKEQRKDVVVDVAVPSEGNIRKKEHENLEKYQGLREELEKAWKGLRFAVSQQRVLLGHQADALSRMATAQQDLFRRMDNISQALMDLTSHVTAAPVSISPHPHPGNMAAATSAASSENFRLQPEPFHGEVEQCAGFLLQCQLIFQQAPNYYQSDHSKITLIVNSLRNKAMQWDQAYLSANPISHLSFHKFLEEFKLVFDQPRREEEATRKLLSLKQCDRSVSDHVIDFRILAVEAGWPDKALKGIFYQSLNEAIKDHLCSQPEALTFEDLVSAALRSDARLRERHSEKTYVSRKPPTNYRDLPTPSNALPSTSVPRGVLKEDSGHKNFMYLPVKVDLQTQVHELQALVDSGAEQSFIDQDLVTQLSIPIEPLETPVKTAGLGGQLLSRTPHRTKPIHLLISGNHHEHLQLFITNAPQNPIVLGFPWLRLHNPHLDWTQGHIVNWSFFCMANFLQSAVPPINLSSHPPEEVDLSKVPTCYNDLRPVFSKIKANSLPPHRPYDCGRLFNLSVPEKEAMEKYIQEALANGHIRPSSSPVGAGFLFVEKKDKTLRPCVDYRELNQITIKDKYSLPLLDSVFDSVQGARVFSKLDLRNAYHLIRVKDGDEWKTAFNTPLGHFEYLVMLFGLTNAAAVFQRLVNDVLRDFLNRFVFVYLDDILIYSPTLDQHIIHVRRVLEHLLENRLFVKAEKCEFHVSTIPFLGYVLEAGNIRPDPAKIEAVLNWEAPTTRKKLQQFLGFANFYRRFIRNISQIASPLTKLTSPTKSFSWDSTAQEAFVKLKNLFVSAPILIQPDPSRQFVVEVDASDSGVGAVLSQKEEKSGKLKPCAFFSKKLFSAEQNYDIGNRELLAIKLALEEWRHWLEGAIHPFIVWTDHKNLAYLRSAKRLNSRQARWCLFFDRFDFTITYRPGSRNIKPDALSRKFCTDDCDSPIIPDTGTSKKITTSQDEEPNHAPGPPGTLYVPTSLRSDVITWGHSSRVSCHAGVHRTLALIRRRFFWPTLDKDVREYVRACSTCARSKSSTSLPSGLLHPLSTPSRPWSHIALDFVTGLTPSHNNTVILTVVDRFSKSVHFVPLPQLPTALETANILVNHVFKYHGIPTDIVSDRGPQFVSQVWKAFCSALGATTSLSSGYHPQSKGQAERANQELEAALRCVATQNTSDWSTYLVWIPSSATGISLFEACLGYLPPLFPSQEADVAVPSIQEHLHRCRRIWRQTRDALLRTKDANCRVANRHRVVFLSSPRPASWHPGSLAPMKLRKLSIPLVFVFVSLRPLRSTLRSTSPRLSQSVTVLFARLPLPHHPPVSLTVAPPSQLIAFWTSGGVVGDSSFWWTGKGTAPRSIPGSLAHSFSTPPLSMTFTGLILTAVLDHLEVVVEGGVLSWYPREAPPFSACS